MARVVAHLIVGTKHEIFLPAMLAGLEPAVEHVFVNENSGLGADAPNLPALESSVFARTGRMTVARTTFETFAAARNVCFDLDTGAGADTWIVFIDADEVHAPRFSKIATQLDSLPAGIGFVDAYTWHFFMSFDWYTSIERRMMFHRWTPQARWEGEVHEQLTGVPGKRIALPYVYAHYGHVAPFAEYARKGAQYSGLGAEGTPLTAQDAHAADFHGDYRAVDAYFAPMWPALLRFTGSHPPAARPIIAQERARRASAFTAIDMMIRRSQTPLRRARNALMKLNYEQRWRARTFEALRYGIR